MNPDAMFAFAIAAKLVLTAGLVVVASAATERTGALLGAMIATLPLSTGPAYIFLALEHDRAFIAEAAIASLAGNAANVVFALVYCLLAQRTGVLAAVTLSLASWFAVALFIDRADLGFAGATALNGVVFAVSLPIAVRLSRVAMPKVERRAFDIPLRATLVSAVVLAVVTLSSRLGPTLTGVLAIFPVVLTSLILIFHVRAGGAGTAALIANAIIGLVGFGFGLAAVHLLAVPLGVAAALVAGLVVSTTFNALVYAVRRRRSA